MNDLPTQTNGTFNDLIAGTYTITVTDKNGCSITSTATLTQPTKVTISAIGSMIDCSNPKGQIVATATGGTSPYQYAIDGTTFQNSGTFSNLNS